MPHYLRAHVPGGSYFFTGVLLEQRRFLLTAHIDALRPAFRSVHIQRPFRIDAIVILPDYLHCIWTLPPSDADFSTRWVLDQIVFRSRHRAGGAVIIPKADETRTGHLATAILGESDPGSKDFDAHLDYIHLNPVKHGWVSRVADWPHSSLHRFVRSGRYPLEWAAPADIREWDLE